MGTMVFQIPGVSIVCSTVCSGADQRKYQSSAPLAFVRWIHQCPVDSPHKGPVTRKMFPFDDVIMPHTVIVFTHALLWKHNERHLQIPVYMPENWMNAKYFQVISLRNLVPLQWRYNERNGVSSLRRLGCLFLMFVQAHIKENMKALRHWPL